MKKTNTHKILGYIGQNATSLPRPIERIVSSKKTSVRQASFVETHHGTMQLALATLSMVVAVSQYGVVLASRISASESICGVCSSIPALHSAAPSESANDEVLQTTRRREVPEVPIAARAVLNKAPRSPSRRIVSASPTRTGLPDNHAGVYLTASGMGKDDFLTQTMQATGNFNGNALVFEAKGDRVVFNSTAPMAMKLDLIRSQFDLKHTLKIARDRGIYTIARFVSVSDSGITRALPETQLHDPKTGHVITPGYIDPQNTDALQYNSEVICELAKAGVDEINLDYIRFSTSNIYATGVFSAEQKADRIEAFIRMARETIDRCGKNTKLGISTFAILGWDYNVNVQTLGQDVVRFAPLVDVISPMAYPSMFNPNEYYNPGVDKGPRAYHLVYRTMTGYQELLGKDAWKLRPWLQGYFVTMKNVQDQVQAVTDAGLCGFMFWNANNNYGTVYSALKNWKVPEKCK